MVGPVDALPDLERLAKQRLGPGQVPFRVEHLAQVAEHLGQRRVTVAHALAADGDGLFQHRYRVVEPALLTQGRREIVQTHGQGQGGRAVMGPPDLDGVAQERFGIGVAAALAQGQSEVVERRGQR